MTNIILFLTLMIPITWSPGPNNVMCASVSSRYGALKSIPFIVGLNTPNLIYSIATGFGLGVIITEYPSTVEILKYAGGVYIFYLGWKILKSHVKTKSKNKDIRFIDGFIVSALNAKSVTVIMLMYSQFIHVSTNRVMLVFTLSAAFVLLCIIGHVGWATIGQMSSKFLLSSKAIKVQNYIFSSLLFVTGIWIIFS
mgnify:CR=1 FL=1